MDKKQRDKPAGGVLEAFLQHGGSLKHFLSRFMITPHEIDDVSQEAFLRAYQVEQSRPIEQPKAFLFRIARNLVLSEFSRKSYKITDYIEDYEQQDFLEGDSLEDNVMAQQKLGIYCEAVASLPEQCRRAVLMKKVYGMSNREIAERMELAVSTVEKHLAKGVRLSTKIISERYGEETKSSTKMTRGQREVLHAGKRGRPGPER